MSAGREFHVCGAAGLFDQYIILKFIENTFLTNN